MSIDLRLGDCLELMRTLADNSVDALVTDPPAGINFMGKDWDHDHGGREGWVKAFTAIFAECYRVLKPGAHALVWALPRTSHWTATALEDAGFEIRDVVNHLFGQGFPKSLDVGKQLEEWDGWGTALKPACEHWVLCRKPLSESTVAANVLKWGTGAINIDECRIDSPKGNGVWGTSNATCAPTFNDSPAKHEYRSEQHPQGRFPANLILSHSPNCNGKCADDCPIKLLNEQSGVQKSGTAVNRNKEPSAHSGNQIYHARNNGSRLDVAYGDTGGASRFFYVPKASRSERNAGLEDMPQVERKTQGRQVVTSIDRRDGKGRVKVNARIQPAANDHPTVKAIALMSYLIRLITPTGGMVLDCFMGSGSTGCAAVREEFSFIGIERKADYFEIAKRRIAKAQQQLALPMQELGRND